MSLPRVSVDTFAVAGNSSCEHGTNLREKPGHPQVCSQPAEQEYWNSCDEHAWPNPLGPLDDTRLRMSAGFFYVQLGAVSGCSRFASTLGFGSLTMFLSCRLIQSSTGKL